MNNTQTLERKNGEAMAALDSELLQAILSYNHEPLVARLQKELNTTKEKADQVFLDTKLFLFICGTCAGSWSPSKMIDEGWHNFIMYTKDYTEFCQKYFGRYLHHNPNMPGERTDRERPRRTLIAAMQLFGRENLSDNWVYYAANGKPAIGPSLPETNMAQALDPCDSCGCSSACAGD